MQLACSVAKTLSGDRKRHKLAGKISEELPLTVQILGKAHTVHRLLFNPYILRSQALSIPSKSNSYFVSQILAGFNTYKHRQGSSLAIRFNCFF